MSRVFLLDVTIFKIHINDTIIDDAQGNTNFHVKIDLFAIPSLIISSNESLVTFESSANHCKENLDYYAGRACHFVSNWSRISDSLKKKPLKIGVYRLNENFPVCHGILPFSGCICDLVTKSMEESSPLEIRGVFKLIDPGGNPAGKISLAIILKDLGEHVVALFALATDSFVVRNELEATEYISGELKESSTSDATINSFAPIDPRVGADYAPENFMSVFAGICLAANELSRGKTKEKKMHEWSDSLAKQTDENEEKPVLATGKKKSEKKPKKKKK